MNRYPEYIEVNLKKYKINTDFRIALRCDEVIRDSSIGEYEKYLAVIYMLLGEDALNDYDNHNYMFELLVKYLRCGKEINQDTQDKEPSMDFKQDIGYIKASFMSDYNIDLDKKEMHWWQFYDLLQGLTENCILNRVRTIREEPLNDKKGKTRQKWIDAKKQVELKREKTKEEKELDKYWESQLRKR